MPTKSSLSPRVLRWSPNDEWKQLMASWLVTSVIFFGPVALFFILSGRHDLWAWAFSGSTQSAERRSGEMAPDFTLRDLEGTPFHLAEEVLKSPVVLEIGSFS